MLDKAFMTHDQSDRLKAEVMGLGLETHEENSGANRMDETLTRWPLEGFVQYHHDAGELEITWAGSMKREHSLQQVMASSMLIDMLVGNEQGGRD